MATEPDQTDGAAGKRGSRPTLPGEHASSSETVPLIERIGSVASAAALQLNTRRLVGVILDQMLLLGMSVAAVFFADADREELKLIDHRGLPEKLIGRIERVPFDAPLLPARAARTREVQALHTGEAAEPGSSFADELFEGTGGARLLALPLIAADKLVGVLALARPGDYPFDDARIAAVRATADVFAATLEVTRIHERDCARLEALRVAALAISSSPGLASVLRAVVDHAHVIVDARVCAVGLLADDGAGALFDPWVVGGFAPDSGVLRSSPPVEGLFASVARDGRTVRLRASEPFECAPGVQTSIPVSFIGVPIVLRAQAIGGLYVADRCNGDAFSDEEERMLELLARHASTAIENARQRAELLDEIARRSAQEQALRESEDRSRRFVERAADIIARWRAGPSFTLEFLSPAVESILGYPPAAYFQNPRLWREQVHPFDRAAFELMMQMPERMTQPLTLRWVHRSGRIVWTEARVVPERDEQGNVIAVEAVVRDVTVRKQAEAEVERLLDQARQARRWLEAVIDVSPAGIVLVEDPFGRCITANREAERIFGRKLDSKAGIQQYEHQIHTSSGAPVEPGDLLMRRALRGETATCEERIGMREDGRETPVLASAAPVRDARGNVTGGVAVYRDISDMKELQRMREEWISIIAHDLNQPVTTIATQAGLLGRKATDPKELARIEHIRDATERLSRMIADLLDVSCVDARRLKLDMRSLDMTELIGRLVEGVAASMRERPIRFRVEGEVPLVRADVHRVEQIFCNLLSNAKKYGYPGTPIDVVIRGGEREVVVSVTNDGEGIAPTEIPHVFDRFRRLASQETGGLGLGLYIARSLVEMHGGRIWGQSEPGHSTTFSFALPALAVEQRKSA